MINPLRGKANRLAVASLLALAVAGCGRDDSAPESPRADTPADAAQIELARAALAEGFADPPPEARPRVWWHWMKGNVTREGIVKDFDWMTEVGIGGVQNFDVDLMTPQVVAAPVRYMTDEWKSMFRFAVEQAEARGLEFSIAASPGWSETGGPWVQPEDGLKKLVWSELDVIGEQAVGMLPAPPQTTGPYADMKLFDPLAAAHGEAAHLPTLYRDIKVLAMPLPPANAVVPSVWINGQAVDAAPLIDDRLQTAVSVEQNADGTPSVIDYRFDEPHTVRGLSLFVERAKIMFANERVTPTLQLSEDGEQWRDVVTVAVSTVPTTLSFAPVSARYFRLRLTPNAVQMSNMGEPMPGIVPPMFLAAVAGDPMAPFSVADFRLLAEPRLHRFEAKAGFALVPDYYELDSPEVTLAGVVPGSVIDVSDKLAADGRLDWTPPPGHWRIVRLGYSLLGTTNHPAPPEATGLEVDKFDAEAVRRYLDTYLGMYREATGDALFGKRGLRGLLTDSIEVGAANWTPRLIEQFQRLRGYDPTPWLPTLAGIIVGSAGDSDRFLYDYRLTLSELMASEHYGTVAEVAHRNGLIVYGEALEDNRPSLGDDLAMRSYADIPMSALWTHGRDTGPKPSYVVDMRGAASVAHVYGGNLAAAESMTSALYFWGHTPASLRRFIDLEFSHGINRPVIHTSVHQPVDDRVPGLSLMIFGQFFNRHDSWAPMAKPWVDYMARNAFMLQQGRYFADVAYFYGEEAPLTGLYGARLPTDTPTRWAYDFVNAEMVNSVLEVDGNALVSAGGMRYRVLYLGGSSARMTLKTLRRLAQLVDAGAIVVGDRPTGSPSMRDDPDEFAALATKLWDGSGDTRHGRGRVIAGEGIETAMIRLGIAPDVEVMADTTDGEVLFLHRLTDAGHSYFINNRLNRAAQLPIRFRVTGRVPELWHADTGLIEPVSYRVDGEHTLVELDMALDESVHLVFATPTTQTERTVEVPSAVAAMDLKGPWTVSFQAGRGAPQEPVLLDALISFDQSADEAIRHFSGIASYRAAFELDPRYLEADTLRLDLGEVADMAEVLVNGQPVATVWHAPFEVDVSGAVQPGVNELEVRVANRWVNRLIGDAARPEAERITWTAMPTYQPEAPLHRAGLLGPVSITAFDHDAPR